PRSTGDDQAARVDDQHPAYGFLPAQSLPSQAVDDLPGDADTARAGSVHHDDLVGEVAASLARRSQQAREDDGASALDVVVERRQTVLVALEHVEGLLLAEVLPLQQRVGEAVPERHREALHEVVVRLTIEALVPDTEVERIVEKVGAVGADVELGRQRRGGIESRSSWVQRELADTDGHPAVPLITDPEDALRVGGDREADIGHRGVGQDLVGPVDVVGADHHATRIAVQVTEPLHGLGHGRCVDDRQHLLEVFLDERVEQDLVAVLQRPQVYVPSDVCRRTQVVGVRARQLLVERRDMWRQQALEAELGALLGRERGALVEQRQACEEEARQVRRQVGVAVVVDTPLVLSHPSSTSSSWGSFPGSWSWPWSCGCSGPSPSGDNGTTSSSQPCILRASSAKKA